MGRGRAWGKVGDLATRAAAAGWMGKLGVDRGGGEGLASAGVSGHWEGCRAPLADSDGRRGATVSVDEEVGTERERRS